MPITKASSSAVAPGAKGDLVVGNATNDSGILAVGSANQVLTVDSSTATGLKWAAAGGGAYTLLSTTTLSGTTTSITGISGDYTDLMVVINNPHTNVNGNLLINPNGTTGTSYNTATTGSTSTSDDRMSGATNLPTSSQPINVFILHMQQYAQSTYGKPFHFYGGTVNQNNAVSRSGFFGATAAITSINITTIAGTASFSGGQVLIYGVK